MDRNSGRLTAGGGPNFGLGLHVALVVGLALFLASFAPGPLVAATAAGLLHMMGLMYAVLAALTREPIWPERLTRWDAAALLFALSLLAGMFTDPAAVAEFLATTTEAMPGGATAPGTAAPQR